MLYNNYTKCWGEDNGNVVEAENIGRKGISRGESE